GASGAIMGLIGIFLILFPINDVSVFYWFFGAAGQTSLSSAWLILFYMASDLAGCIFDGRGAVAYVAHLGGAVGGIITAVVLVRTGVIPPPREEKKFVAGEGFRGPPAAEEAKKETKPSRHGSPGRLGSSGPKLMSRSKQTLLSLHELTPGQRADF